MKSLLIILPAIILNTGIISLPHHDLTGNYSAPHNEKINSRPIIPDTALKVRPFHLEIVAPSSGVQFYKNGILFLSYSKGDGKMTEKHLSFGTLKPFISIISDTVPGEYMPFHTGSSVIFPSEATTFSQDYNTMYFSMIPEKMSKEKIFRATYVQNGWVIEDTPLDFCKENYIYTHPALSVDGKLMIFSSDMAGSSGGLDLYVTRRENDKWSDPVNLGTLINTSGNELFASLDAENNLYFSSDGLKGLGGYDIYISRPDGENWQKPENLTSAINSQNDEVAFNINPSDGKSAFYTSRPKSIKNKSLLLRVTPVSDTSPDKALNLSSTFLALTGSDAENQHSIPAVTATTTANKPETKVEIPSVPVQVKKETGQPAQTAKAETPVKVAEVKPESKVQPKTEPGPEQKAEPKAEPKVESKPTQQPELLKGSVVYRVQVLANTKPVGSYDLTVANKTYKTYEYLYAGAYRTTVGEFSTLSEAVKFQNICRQSGYSQAFVVAFKDNVRTNDPQLFKK